MLYLVEPLADRCGGVIGPLGELSLGLDHFLAY